MDISTNTFERQARAAKVTRLADTAETMADKMALHNDLALVAEFWADASDAQWRTLEYAAGTRPQQTQDHPASSRTRQRVVNLLVKRARRSHRFSDLADA